MIYVIDLIIMRSVDAYFFITFHHINHKNHSSKLFMSKSILKKDKRYSFSDYFYMSNPAEEIIAELGYHLDFEEIQFSLASNIEQSTVDRLKNFYYRLLPKITINSEMAKREFMIAPLLHEVIFEIDAKLNVEYPIDVDDKLNGLIDYLIRSKQELIVIEAKKGDLERGLRRDKSKSLH